MHHIQYKIVDQLIRADTLRFSELKPKGLESNLFQYHLKHTMKEGYVDKVEGGYQLSAKGLRYADRHSSALKGTREQPKIITVIAVRDAAGRVLLKEKDRQPFVGRYHLPAGKIHSGETVDAAARRELAEKMPGFDTKLHYVATAQARIYAGTELISDFLAFVYTGQTEADLSDGVWYDYRYPDRFELAPSVGEILELLGAPPSGVHHIVVNL